MKVIVRYIGHSGFMVEAGGFCLVFDYYVGRSPAAALAAASRPFVFASHAHGDHFNPDILCWKGKAPGLTYILSYDIPAQEGAVPMAPGQVWEGEGIRVLALPSTDAGVAFRVEAGGVSLFHAGDLNDWHWQDVSTAEEAEQARRQYVRALSGLEGLPVDIAFLPVDPRLGTAYDRGARFFCQRYKPRHVFSMHFGQDWRAPADFALWVGENCPGVTAHDLLRPGQRDAIDLEEGR